LVLTCLLGGVQAVYEEALGVLSLVHFDIKWSLVFIDKAVELLTVVLFTPDIRRRLLVALIVGECCHLMHVQ